MCLSVPEIDFTLIPVPPLVTWVCMTFGEGRDFKKSAKRRDQEAVDNLNHQTYCSVNTHLLILQQRNYYGK